MVVLVARYMDETVWSLLALLIQLAIVLFAPALVIKLVCAKVSYSRFC